MSLGKSLARSFIGRALGIGSSAADFDRLAPLGVVRRGRHAYCLAEVSALRGHRQTLHMFRSRQVNC